MKKIIFIILMIVTAAYMFGIEFHEEDLKNSRNLIREWISTEDERPRDAIGILEDEKNYKKTMPGKRFSKIGAVWYRFHFTLKEVKEENFVFVADNIDDEDEVYINGVKVGETKTKYYSKSMYNVYYNIERFYSVPKELINFNGKDNLIVIKVTNDFMGGGIFAQELSLLKSSYFFDEYLYKYKKRIGENQYMFLLMIGFAIAVFAYNLFSYIFVREKYHLYLTFTMVMFIIYVFAKIDKRDYILGFPFISSTNTKLELIAIIMITTFINVFIRNYFNIKNSFLHKANVIINITFALLILVLTKLPIIQNTFYVWYVFLIFQSFMNVFLVKGKNQNIQMKFMRIGVYFFVATVMYDLMREFRIVNFFNTVLSTYGFTFLILMMIISVAINYMNTYNKVNELNKNLEKKVEERTRELSLREKELLKAKEDAEEANFTKGRFLANMSHEIRTPLNGIIGAADLMENSAIDSRQKRLIEIIKISGTLLMSIINDILDFSKIEANKLAIEKIRFDMGKLLHEVVEITEINVKIKEIEFKSNIKIDLENILIGDPVRIKQILLNLISNAIKFTEKGKIEFGAEIIKKDNDKVIMKFYVADTGIGIPEEKLDKIFGSFEQADVSTTRKYGGTGLGLAIVKNLVELMQGEIEVESTHGEGTLFKFIIPFEIAEKIEHGEIIEENKNEYLNGIRVLLVEDNLINQEIIAAFFEKLGYIVDIADNGNVAIDKIERKKYDIIVSDLQMPEMNGYELAKEMKKKEPEIKIIAITASADTIVKERCFDCGFDDYITKPINFNDMVSKIERIMKK